MFVEADAGVVIAFGPHQQLAPERAIRFQGMLDAIILRAKALAVLLTLITKGRDYVGRTAHLGQRGLDRRAGRLLGLEEDEFMLVRNDHEIG